MTCQQCGHSVVSVDITTQPQWCGACVERYPASLLKATIDPFDYELRVDSGEVIRFESAIICGGWASLTIGHGCAAGHDNKLQHGYPRGIDVRVSAIVWCADAPDGS